MSVLALADCNNFFVSCERVFRPGLEGRPVVVLSNNDGCVISRSDEAKALGIGMGAPFFEVRALCAENGVVSISANHELYADMSRRATAVFALHSPRIETYSIDESFLTWPDSGDPAERARALRADVLRWTGLPISVGVAPTKALAKLASDRAKSRGGALVLLTPEARAHALADTPLERVWGIARRSAERLSPWGARTAADFAAMDDAAILKALGVGGLRLARELRGFPALAFAPEPPPRKSVLVSRSFGRPVAALAPLETAAAAFAARAAERARRHGLAAGALRVFLGWRENGRPAAADAQRRLPPTADTAELARAARELIGRIFVEARDYRKAGVILGELVRDDNAQPGLFDDGGAERARRRMRAMDRLNAAYGAGTVRLGAEALPRSWSPRSRRRSPCWTTRWNDLPRVGAGT